MVQASTVRIRLVGSAPGWENATERDKALTAETYVLTDVASATVGSDTYVLSDVRAESVNKQVR